MHIPLETDYQVYMGILAHLYTSIGSSYGVKDKCSHFMTEVSDPNCPCLVEEAVVTWKSSQGSP